VVISWVADGVASSEVGRNAAANVWLGGPNRGLAGREDRPAVSKSSASSRPLRGLKRLTAAWSRTPGRPRRGWRHGGARTARGVHPPPPGGQAVGDRQ
jgi:hypothetical protein